MSEALLETNRSSAGLDDALTPSRCPLCHRLFQLSGSLKPKLLPCLHTFCCQCIELQSHDERFTCPLDSQECRNVAGIMDQYFVLEKLKKDKLANGKSQDNMCEGCAADDDAATNEITASATGYCKQCADWLCDSCIAAHRKVRITKEHEIVSQNEYLAQIGSDCGKWRLCPVHSGQMLSMFCDTCQVITCRLCQADPKHADHNCQYLNLKAATERSVVTNLANDVMVKKDGMQAQRSELEKRKSSVKVLEASLINEIDKFFQVVQQKVECAKNDLIGRVKLKCDDVEKRTNAQSERLCKVQNIMAYAIMFSRKSVAFEDPFPLMQSRIAVLSQLRNLMKIPSHSLTVDDTSLRFQADESRIISWISSLAKVIDDTEERNSSAAVKTAPQPTMKTPIITNQSSLQAPGPSPNRSRGRVRMSGPLGNSLRKSSGMSIRGPRISRGATHARGMAKSPRIILSNLPKIPNKAVAAEMSPGVRSVKNNGRKMDDRGLMPPTPGSIVPPRMNIPMSNPISSSSPMVRPSMADVQARLKSSPKQVRANPAVNEMMQPRIPSTMGQASPPQVLYPHRMHPMTSHSNMAAPGVIAPPPTLQPMTTVPPFTMAINRSIAPPVVRPPPPSPMTMSKEQMEHWKGVFSSNQIDFTILPESERANESNIYSAVQAQLAFENRYHHNYLQASEMAQVQGQHPGILPHSRQQLSNPGMFDSRVIVSNANFNQQSYSSQTLQNANPALRTVSPASIADYAPSLQKSTQSVNRRQISPPARQNHFSTPAVNSPGKPTTPPNSVPSPNLKRKITCHKQLENSTQFTPQGTKIEQMSPNDTDDIAGVGYSGESNTKKQLLGASNESPMSQSSSSPMVSNMKSDDEVFCITESCSPVASKANASPSVTNSSNVQMPRQMPEGTSATQLQPAPRRPQPHIPDLFQMNVQEQMKSGNNATNQNTSSTIESNRPPQPERNAPSTQQIFDLSDVTGEPILCLGEVKSQHQQAPNLSALKTVISAPPAKPGSGVQIATNANLENRRKSTCRGNDLEELKMSGHRDEMTPIHSLSPDGCSLSPNFLSSFGANFLDNELSNVNKLDLSSVKGEPCESLFECLSKIGDLRDATDSKSPVFAAAESRDEASHKKGAIVVKEEPMQFRHEEWCAVCDDGGDMILCDTCPKIYHLECHVPLLKQPPSGDFSCTLCRPMPTVSEEKKSKMNRFSKMTPEDKKLCEKLMLLMYCHPDGEDFYKPIPEDFEEYHLKISNPSDFSTVRKRLSRSLKTSSSSGYVRVSDFLLDLEQVFNNALTFNGINSELGRIAKEFLSCLASETEKIFGVQYSKLTGAHFFRRGKSLKEDIDIMSGQNTADK